MEQHDLPAILGGTPMFEQPHHLVRPTMPSLSDIAEDYNALCASRMLTNQGQLVRSLEARIAERVGVKHCALFCNATTAIMSLLKALGAENAVIVPSFTFAATVQPLIWQGIEPVFADIDRHTLKLTAPLVEKAIQEHTGPIDAIFPVNIFGSYCDHQGLEEVSKQYSIPLIYDSAQAFGASYNGQMAGSLGLAEVFSFHATKIFHTGEGGAITTNQTALYESVCRIRNFGFGDYLNCLGPGLNGKMSEFNALIGLNLIEKFDEHIAKRKWVFKNYRDALSNIQGIELPKPEPGVETNYSYFHVVIDPDKFGLTNVELNYALIADNVISRCYFYPPVHQTTFYREQRNNAHLELPNTDWAAGHVLCLPVYSDMQMFELAKIIDAIGNCQHNSAQIREYLVDHVPPNWHALSSSDYEDPYDRFVNN